jgi:ribosome modulation factor
VKPSREQYEQAVNAGEAARRAGRKRDSCPIYGMGEYGRILQEAWYSGWDRVNEERKR